MTTGEGGMVTTNNLEMVKKMKSMREFGKIKKVFIQIIIHQLVIIGDRRGKFLNGSNAIKEYKNLLMEEKNCKNL